MLLAVIRSGEVADFQRQLIDAQSDLSVSEKNLEVQQELYESGLLSERELVSAQKQREKARAELRHMEQLFAIYHFNDQSECHIYAPISGFVIQKSINRDMMLPSNHSESVFTIAELDEVLVVAHVYESEIAKVKPGIKAFITTLSYPDQVLKGTVDKIFNVLDPTTRTMKVHIRLQNPDFSLKPEMLAQVRLHHQQEHSFPSVAAQALIFDKGRNFVMIFRGKRDLEPREVKAAKVGKEWAWIKKGLEPGEVVIAKNQLFIYDALTD